MYLTTRFLRSLGGVTLRDRIKSEEIKKKWNVEEMIDDVQNYQNGTNMFLGGLKIDYHAISTPRKKGFRKTLPSLERPVHVVAERELNPKLRMKEE